MKMLNRILLVNWYLLSAEQIDIKGNTAFIGPNASGKSSILDAIQAVLLGGDQRLIQLNASAGEKSRRTLREYCLGVVRDPSTDADLDPDLAPRRQAVSYIVLCFRDDETNDETAIGLAMHAHLDNGVFEVDGRFIVPRASLILRDLIESVGGEDRPIPWDRVREDLRRRCHAQGAEFENLNESGRFIKRLGEALGYGGRSFEPIRFARSLKNAVTFAPIKDVSEFVRRHILDDKPIRVKALQESLKNYRDIEAKTKEVRDRIAALKLVQAHYLEAARRGQRAVQYDWIEMEAAVLRLDDERVRIEVALEQIGQQSKALEVAAKDLTHHDAQDQTEVVRLNRLIAASGSEAKRQELEARIETQQTHANQAGNDLDIIRRNLSAVWKLLDFSEDLPKPFLTVLQTLADTLPQDELLVPIWPEAPEIVEQLASEVHTELEAVLPGVQERAKKLGNEVEIMNTNLLDLRERLQTLQRGETPLSRKAQALIALLNQHNIGSRPLCDCVEIVDERWRDCIERYLGSNREALIVTPEDARDAISVYRRQGRELFGARVINTRKTQDWLKRCEPGSLAEIITTDDDHARAYINRLLGRVMRVYTEDELLRQERAATDDGMLAANGAIERMAPVQDHLLGRASRELTCKRLESQFQEDAAKYAEADRTHRRFADVSGALADFARKLGEGIELTALAANRTNAQSEIKRLKEELGQLDLKETDTLKQKLKATQDSIETRKKQFSKLETQKNDLLKETTLQEEKKRLNNEAFAQAVEDRTRRTQTATLKMAEASAQFERLQTEHGEDLNKVEETARQRARKNRTEQAQSRDAAHADLREYALKHSALLPGSANQMPEDLHAELEAWSITTLTNLEDTQLAGLTDRAEKARLDAEQIFHAQFIGQLRDNLAGIDDALDELNRNLKKRNFHGELYQFKKFDEKEFEPLIKWIKSATAEVQANVGSLFDTQALPGSEHFEARKKIRELLMGGADGAKALEDKLVDYRNYYRFDVEMKDPNRANSTAWLSQRLGKGSGGEHQAPFYVAIGAALAATYRLERDEATGKVRGGMALALFDEAFSKLDVGNTQSALAFLRDLGMQAVIAAPDERHALLAEEMDTIVNVYRDGGAVSIEPQYFKPALHALLAADNPFKAHD
ncbi:MAG: hypothetical protein GZ085_07995 [Sulfuriferula multivorans]|uniref:Chromosome segregation protein SMC-like n=1 Tax=Sulfuriferula multivorans TaxID=1559896 RepID=A0A7C9NT22_9PROT|nr:hypothetical protein [Sulfuriferula multivorans]